MTRRSTITPAVALCASVCCNISLLRAAVPKEIMPHAGDFTSMWWAEGFPGVIPEAPWLRCIQTGNYALILDTEAMKVTQLGPVPAGTDYATFGISGTPAQGAAAPADLELNLSANGKIYRCTGGGKWSRFDGPRLIESGRFFQRADVTDLVFTAADGEKLNAEARFETVAWPDRLGLTLAARPGCLPIQPGPSSFGKIGGGFGLDGKNHFEVPHEPALDPEHFTLELWAFIPAGYSATQKSISWLVCKNLNEAANGNFGLTIGFGGLQARMNIGGRDGQFTVETTPQGAFRIDAWNHLAVSYDGDTFRLYVNGKQAGEKKIGLKRTPGKSALIIGRRGDNSGDGYHFRGIVDEIRLYDRALTSQEVEQEFSNPGTTRPGPPCIREWRFDPAAPSSEFMPRESWKNPSLEVKLAAAEGGPKLQGRWQLPDGPSWADDWQQASLSFNPATWEAAPAASPVSVVASEIPAGTARPVSYDSELGWHRVNLDGIEPIAPPGITGPSNDAIERVKLVLSNPTDQKQIARLMFEKMAGGFRQRIGAAITGISAMLRDSDGNPTGIPVQISKNWHNRPEAGAYEGTWFHGITQVRLPAASTTELELTICYGHWGGVAAASHTQLSLVGWGSNQHWTQSALGSWGESICYEPEQVQADCTITDVRPVMVCDPVAKRPWNWTGNVGGGDFFRFFDPAGKRVPHSAMRTTYQRHGPCLTEVTFAGKLGQEITHRSTVSQTRTDDLMRSTYQIRLDVNQATDFSRFVIFQIGADTYSYTGERKMAVGDETGLIKQWNTQWGGDVYRTEPLECTGPTPWASLHEAVPREEKRTGEWANRGIVIRAWKARLGGKEASPWMAERGIKIGQNDASTLDLVPPPGVTRLEPGDFVEATVEHIGMPQFANSYYGPNEALKAALMKDENTWRMIFREAAGNQHNVEVTKGTFEKSHPDVRIRADGNQAAFTLASGLGYVPVTFTDLTKNSGYILEVDGKPLDQTVHGGDFWQSDYDPVTQRWSRTYNLPVANGAKHSLVFSPQP
ncbi:MAG: LamG domain-containing protein [Akkermansiaceae bacterium]